jgi:hypothetical protein
MAALIQGDEPTTAQVSSHPIPVPGVRAQTVKQEDRRFRGDSALRRPLDEVEPDSVAIDPAGPRFAHRLKD